MGPFYPADILLPQNMEYDKWSVVACDQYTSEPDYWKRVAEITDGVPSAYHIIFPEVYLGDGDEKNRIKSICETMRFYNDMNYFKELTQAMIYVERDFGDGRVRRGIVGCVDLEEYNFKKNSKSLIRATEETVAERIPPRAAVRADAPLEAPHVMLLIDDEDDSVIGGVTPQNGEEVYNFPLMQNGGSLYGSRLTRDDCEHVMNALDMLADKKEFRKKYGVKNSSVLLFAVGDGNHSLATAKTCWDKIKKTLTKAEQQSHPARYALVEIVNLHDRSLVFEPIHRVLFDVEPENVIDEFIKYYDKNASLRSNGGQRIRYCYKGKRGSVYVKNAPSNIAVGTLQTFLDDYLKKHKKARIDYIHGDDVAETLGARKDSIAFLLPAMEKSELFPTVIKDGALPRKTFSMGDAREKRYYMECKRIR
jgi:uncharacterized protein (DUF1015 family)